MIYEPEKYSDLDIFSRIERLVCRRTEFITEQERLLYRRERYESCQEKLLYRFRLIIKQAGYFLVEESYTEHTWKELHALHYANTNYAQGNKVIRIHFWTPNLYAGGADGMLTQDMVGKGYLGYVTLRPVPDYNLMLSSIMPNWEILKYDKSAWIMTYEKEVHIAGFNVRIRTMPFYFQDTVFIRCAHADMLMFSTFLHHAYKFPRLSIADMIENNRYYPVPDAGLEYSDMLDIFYRNRIPVNFYAKPKGSESQNDLCIAILDAHLESRLPVIVYNDQHVVLVIGHTDDKIRRYIVYDDSGYFLSEKAGSVNFIGSVEAEDLFPNQGVTYMIAATYERVYLNPQGYFGFLNEYLENFEKKEEDQFPVHFAQCRNMIVDNVVVKNFLKFNCMELDDVTDRNMDLLLQTDLPHYLWYSEYNCREYRFVLVADPTYPSATGENIFPYGGFFCIPEGNGMSLLTRVEGCKK